MWIVTVISVFGSILNARKSNKCFYVWIIANVFWLIYDIYTKLYSRAALDILQTIICISGIIHWRKEENDENYSRRS